AGPRALVGGCGGSPTTAATSLLGTPLRSRRTRSTSSLTRRAIAESRGAADHLPRMPPSRWRRPRVRRSSIDDGLEQIRDSVARDLLERISRASPRFFESLALDLLHAMGYGTSRADLEHVGGSGDGGIDGVISLDRLGLEKVFVQAKRWSGRVG